jgi:hypothetical protein
MHRVTRHSDSTLKHLSLCGSRLHLAEALAPCLAYQCQDAWGLIRSAVDVVLTCTQAVRGAAHVQPLLATLASRQPALRRAAADTLRHLAERWADFHLRPCDCSSMTGEVEHRGATSMPICAASRGPVASDTTGSVGGTHAGSRAALMTEQYALDSHQQPTHPCGLVSLRLPVLKLSLLPASAAGTQRQSTGRA